MNERRKHKRYEIKDGMVVWLGSYSAQIGQLVDIGYGGVSFHYKGRDEAASDPCEISIVFDKSDNAKYAPFNFKTNLISDVKVENTDNIQGSSFLKRCHMQFNDLSYHQKIWLEDCIKELTAVPDKP